MGKRHPKIPVCCCATEVRGERLHPNGRALPLEGIFREVGRCKRVLELYLIFLSSFFGGDHGVEAVSPGLVAHHADGPLVLLAEELQNLPVLPAQILPSRCSSSCPQAQLPGDFGNIR